MLFFFYLVIQVICILVSVAFFSLLERKVLGYLHYRNGPNKASLMGVLQPLADALNLFSNNNRPLSLSDGFFFLPTLFIFFMSLLSWIVYPFWNASQSFNYSALATYVILGLGVYGLMLSGYFSNSNFSLIGALRAVCQSLSYEVVLGLIFLCFILFYKSTSYTSWATWGSIFFFNAPLFFLFFLTFLAELNRAPFDLSEGESELVSGYSVEYGGVSYTLIFLSENIYLFFSSFIICFFFFDFGFFYFLNWAFICFLSILLRGVTPRIRYDVLIFFCWNFATPASIFFVTMYLGTVELF